MRVKENILTSLSRLTRVMSNRSRKGREGEMARTDKKKGTKLLDPNEIALLNPEAPPLEAPWSSETVFVSPEQARIWLAQAAYESQRPIRPWHVTELGEALRAGEHVARAIKFNVMPDGSEYLTDGQHFLHAIDESGVGSYVTVMRVPVTDMIEIAHDYTNTDRPVARTIAEGYRTYNLLEKTGLSTAQVNALGGALKVLIDGFASTSLRMNRPDLRSSKRRIEGIFDWAQEAREIFEAMAGGSNAALRVVMMQAPFAVALVTMRFQPDQAVRFWGAVSRSASEDGYPPATLRERLIAIRGERTQPNVLARLTANAWNGFVEGRELKALKPGDTSRPIRILGTPYDGTRRLNWGEAGNTLLGRPRRSDQDALTQPSFSESSEATEANVAEAMRLLDGEPEPLTEAVA